jgi:RimJ/RimL family protein N-acetyltransferase
MITLIPLAFPSELREAEAFIMSQPWPYHSIQSPGIEDVSAMAFAPPETASFWVLKDATRVGLVRLQDLADIGDGSPVFDLRLDASARGRGVGRVAVGLLCEMSFSRWPELHRIEGTTRDDNVAMQRVFEACGFQLEGRLRETWPTPEGRWHDTLVYGQLRREWENQNAPTIEDVTDLRSARLTMTGTTPHTVTKML